MILTFTGITMKLEPLGSHQTVLTITHQDQSIFIRGRYKREVSYKGEAWTIQSVANPEINLRDKTIFVRGFSEERDFAKREINMPINEVADLLKGLFGELEPKQDKKPQEGYWR